MNPASSILHVHAFWTRPLLLAQATPDAMIELWDFEILTWLASALKIRRYAPLRLVTDTRGLQFVQRGGFDWVYSGGISTDLDAIPADLNVSVFWAAAKLYALRSVEAPCVSIDTDAILWQAPNWNTPLVALHTEDRRWPWYADDETLFANFGFRNPGWDWSIDPLNTAVTHFARADLLEHYQETAIRFMVEYSRFISRLGDAAEAWIHPTSDPMIFAEQRLLPMCAARLGVPTSTLLSLAQHGHLPPNPLCTHLWSSKAVYMSCAEARTTYVNHLIDDLWEHHPEARETLTRWNLDRHRVPDSSQDLDLDALPLEHPQRRRFSLLRNISGTIWIEDANVAGLRRQARDGGLVWTPETIRPERGATFELVVAGTDKIRIHQPDQAAT